MNKLPDDLTLEIIKNIDSVEALQKFCKLNKQNNIYYHILYKLIQY
jgi:hypothetical protein